MKIAVVGIQGDVLEHIESLKTALQEMNIMGEIIWARKKGDLNYVDGIVIPGGESTTISRLMSTSGMDKVVKELANKGLPILGTCAGTILLSKFNLIDIKVERNAYGRQKDSFESTISTPVGKIKGIFIRAPLIKEIFGESEIFSTHNQKIIGAKQGNILALTFHPELSNDTRIHKYFLKIIIERRNQSKKR